MPITWSNKPGLQSHLNENGYYTIRRDGVFNAVRTSDNATGPDIDTAVQALIDGYDPIDFAKTEKRDEIKAEGLSRITDVFPAINDLDELKLEQERWLSIAPAARQPTTDYQKAINIYVAARNAITSINTESDWTVVNAYDVVTGPSWPV
jgi:hypothetical protein